MANPDDDKDRLGDKLHRKEKAEENLFFARRDRELLARQRREAEAAAKQPTHACPHCGERLETTKRAGVPVERCPAGHGMWLDQGEMETIAKREKNAWLTRLVYGE